MTVLHVCDENSRTGSGVFAAVRTNLAGIQGARPDMRIVLAIPGGGMDPMWAGVQVTDLPASKILRAWRGGFGLSSTIAREVRAAHVVHAHSVWMAPEVIAGRCAERYRRPWVASAHGMLQPAEYARKHFKKALFWNLAGAPTFSRATALHAITTAERDTLHGLLPQCRIEVVPNAIDLAQADAEGAATPQLPEPRCLMFFGRIVPGKGVNLLIAALAKANLPVDWRLEVVGPCAPEYQRRLASLAEAHGVAERVQFVGAVSGTEKWRRLKRAWIAVMPSLSEVVGMANLEAATAGVPTLVGPGAGLLDRDQAGGLVVTPEVVALAQALRQAACWSSQEREQRGHGLRRLVERRYCTTVTGRQFCDLYEELAG